MGDVYTFEDHKGLRTGQSVHIGTITMEKGVLTVKGLKKGHSSQEQWGVKTNEWSPVDMVMLSPNFWDGAEVGNKHLFFMLKDCKNPEDTRGFYNEYLRGDLHEHRKVFEVLASQLKVPYNDNQLSGVGISSTQKSSIKVRVTGAKTRIVNIIF